MPRFKVRHEGSEIYYRDQLLIYNNKMATYGLHASDKNYDPLHPLPTGEPERRGVTILLVCVSDLTRHFARSRSSSQSAK